MATAIIFVLSSWGPVVLNIGGFNIPEIIILPLAVYLYFRIPNLRYCAFSKEALLSACWLFLLSFLGMLRTESIVGPYSELRASLILVCGFILMYKSTDQEKNLTDILFLISFSVLCLDSLLILLQILIPGFLNIPESNDFFDTRDVSAFGFGRVSIPAISILVSAYLSSRTKRISMLFFVLFLGAILSLGGHRIILLTTAISTLFVPLCIYNIVIMEKLKFKWIKVLQILTYLIVLITFFQSDIVRNYLVGAEFIRYRLFNKTVDTVEGIASGTFGNGTADFGEEGIRAAYFSYLIENSPWLLLPHGLGSREVYGKLGNEFDQIAEKFGASGESGNTHDMAVLYMAYHHGLLITGLLTCFAIFLVYRRLKFARGGIDRAYVITALIGILAIDLAYPPVPGINIALVYGMFLGLLLNQKPNKYKYSNMEAV